MTAAATRVRVVRDAQHGWLGICQECGATATARIADELVETMLDHVCEEER